MEYVSTSKIMIIDIIVIIIIEFLKCENDALCVGFISPIRACKSRVSRRIPERQVYPCVLKVYVSMSLDVDKHREINPFA